MAEPGLALLTLYDGVEAQFTLDGTPAPLTFGWRERSRQRATSQRLVWVPGDDKSKDRFNVGKVVAPSKRRLNTTPGPKTTVPRHLANLLELCTVYCVAADVSTPELERSQYAKAWILFNAFHRAVYRCAVGNFQFLTVDWVTKNNGARSYGAALRVLLEMRAAMPDLPLGPTGPEAGDLVATDADDLNYTAETLDGGEPPTVINTISGTVSAAP